METGWLHWWGDYNFKPALWTTDRPISSSSDVFRPKWKVPSSDWSENESERVSGVTHWPLQNLLMASNANEKQRGRGMWGDDPFKAPRSPPPVSSTGPRDKSSFTAEDDENTEIDGRLLEREIQHVNGVTLFLPFRLVVKRTRVSGLDYSLRLHRIEKIKNQRWFELWWNRETKETGYNGMKLGLSWLLNNHQ